MANRLWAGLDVGVETTNVCVIDDAGEVVHEAKCKTDLKSVSRELALLKRRRGATVGLEAGTGVHLARGLRDKGYQVEIYEARQLSKFLRVRRNKTDAGDANGIAQAGRIAAPLVSKVYLKSLECQSLATRLRVRRFVIQTRNRAFCLLCRQLEMFGGRLKSRVRSASLRKEVAQQVKKYVGRGPGSAGDDLLILYRLCEELLQREISIDKELAEFARQNEVCRRLMTIPGVGPICALSFYSAIGEPSRFRKATSVGAYLGLTPRVHQSGLLRRSGRISRMGNREARSLLFRSSLHFMMATKPGIALRDWTTGIEQRRGKGKSRVALARKLATIMVAMWKSGEAYCPNMSAKDLALAP